MPRSPLSLLRRSPSGAALPPAPAVILDSCQYVAVDDSTALVRVTGTGLTATIELIARSAEADERFEALADAGELPPLRWRAAFAVPAAYLHAAGSALVLDVGGSELELERPGDESGDLREQVEELRREVAARAARDELARTAAERSADEATQAYAQLAVVRSENERMAARVEELEGEIESFVSRRDEALAASAAERIAALESELQAQRECIADLQSMLVSERETVAKARDEVERLRDRLEITPKPVVAGAAAVPEPAPGWTALDEELLGRLEKAKGLTQP